MPPIRNTPSTASSSTLKSSKGTLTSWIWDHGTKIPSNTGLGAHSHWQCNHCHLSFNDSTTSNAINHLQKQHSITQTGRVLSDQKTIRDGAPIIHADVLRKLIIEWIVDRRHAFNEVEVESFLRIIEYINVTAVSKIPRAANTIRGDMIKYFEEAKLTI